MLEDKLEAIKVFNAKSFCERFHCCSHILTKNVLMQKRSYAVDSNLLQNALVIFKTLNGQ